MQQGGAAAGGGGGGGGGSLSLYGISSTAEIASPIIAATTTSTTTHMMQQQQQQQPVEAASPISSRPPQSLDELMALTEDAIGGGSSGGGNRWPRQETLALIKIRTDMDTAFRDATVKGPLWDDVSRKLAELGYRRNAKKCKEKFENVHKYYKRTRESRAGRQDGKSYKFFEQLEALHNTTPTAAAASVSASASQQQMPITTATAGLDVSPVSVGIPMAISSVRTQPLSPPAQPRTNATNTILPGAVTTASASVQMSFNVFPHNLTAAMTLPQPTLLPSPAAPVTAGTSIGLSFSSNTSSASSQGTEDDEEDDDDNDEDESEGQPEPSDPSGFSRKRKRNSGGRSSRRMMEFFEKLMKQVTERQEAMQQKFLEIIEKREQDRMIRDEAWKRQEMARLNREHEILAQERAVSASRDAAIVSFLQTLTGQTIQFPQQQQPIPSFTPPPPPPQPAPPPAQPQPQHSSLPVPQQQLQIDHQPRQIQQNPSTEIVIAIPEQQITPQDISGGSFDPISSRWPKAEVLALINMRSSLEIKYEEAGPKGPLWEEISAGMMRLGYKRNAKRCKEKWENINKYFKKVKESNKKRPEDSKTCPYYHQLDALYQRKIIRSMSGGGGTSIGGGSAEHPPQLEAAPPIASTIGLPGSLFEEGNGGTTKEPEDIVMNELMKQQRGVQAVPQQQQYRQQLTVEDYEKMDETDSENTQIEDDEEEDEDDRKMDYKIEFQRKNNGGTNSGGGNNGAPSFMALVQ